MDTQFKKDCYKRIMFDTLRLTTLVIKTVNAYLTEQQNKRYEEGNFNSKLTVVV